LTAAVGVMNQPGSWSSAGQRHLQRVGRELSAQVIGECPAHDAPAERTIDPTRQQSLMH